MADIYSFLLNQNPLHLSFIEHENGKKDIARKSKYYRIVANKQFRKIHNING